MLKASTLQVLGRQTLFIRYARHIKLDKTVMFHGRTGQVGSGSTRIPEYDRKVTKFLAIAICKICRGVEICKSGWPARRESEREREKRQPIILNSSCWEIIFGYSKRKTLENQIENVLNMEILYSSKGKVHDFSPELNCFDNSIRL